VAPQSPHLFRPIPTVGRADCSLRYQPHTQRVDLELPFRYSAKAGTEWPVNRMRTISYTGTTLPSEEGS